MKKGKKLLLFSSFVGFVAIIVQIFELIIELQRIENNQEPIFSFSGNAVIDIFSIAISVLILIFCSIYFFIMSRKSDEELRKNQKALSVISWISLLPSTLVGILSILAVAKMFTPTIYGSMPDDFTFSENFNEETPNPNSIYVETEINDYVDKKTDYVINEITRLENLKKNGVINEEEFSELKQKLFNEI